MADDSSTPPPSASDPAGSAKKVSRAPRQGLTMGEKQSAQSAPPAAPAGVVDPAQISPQLLAALSQALGAPAAPPAAPAAPPAAERPLIAREEKRFRRTNAAPAADVPAPAAEVPSPATEVLAPAVESTPPKPPSPASTPTETKPLTAPAEESPAGELEEARHDAERGVHLKGKDAPAEPIPTAGKMWRKLSPERRALIALGAGAALLLPGMFFLGRETAPAMASRAAGAGGSAAPAVENAPGLSRPARIAEPSEIERVNVAFQAMTTNDLPRSEAALLRLLKESPDLPGTYLALALLEMQRSNFSKSEHYISLGISAGEPAGPYYELRAALASRANQRKRADESFLQAVRADPFSWRHLFRWSEFLRRVGRNEAALEKIDLAIARIHEQADEDLMQFKRALILVALGRGAELDATLARRAAENPPPGEWLLVGFAREAERGDMTAAARWLGRATKQENAAWLSEHLRDFYLQQWCYEKELAALYRPFLPRLEAARREEGSVAAPDADAAAAQARQQARSPLTAPAAPPPEASAPPAAAPATRSTGTADPAAPAAEPSPTPPLDLGNLLPPPK